MGLPCGSADKESACNVEDLGSIPGLERSPGEGSSYPQQYSGLENSVDYIVHGGGKESDTTEATEQQQGISHMFSHSNFLFNMIFQEYE